jgi:Calcineurin-like phosphoesterase
VLDVGDYLYRENPCPADAQAQCGGTPSGDNWNAWNADFFEPAAKLLEAAPWVFARGNHEDCKRSWRGFFYYLDPRPWSGACVDTSPPYIVKVGKFETAVFDSSSTDENSVKPAQLATFSSQLAGLHVNNAWLLDHHPFWAVRPGGRGKPPTAQTMVLQEAWDKAAPRGINMVLSGHIHLFEVLSFGQGRPLQIVAGDGGTNLAQPVPEKVNGMEIHGIMVGASESKHEFGYTLLTKRGSGWDLELKNPQGGTRVKCRITFPDTARDATCEGGSPR